ncbi:hypothetical protein HPB51_005382 [Rhipicephalus microplus]|uniref:Helitron helicase-like domain-containing protein n=1 Tax=Rhipicephalus microplus TaxID=6941 RepID=A0A9J6DFG3_RHIMP|nr:hypothetical protein HPB51_005382 [Rhipicephalus microplus]
MTSSSEINDEHLISAIETQSIQRTQERERRPHSKRRLRSRRGSRPQAESQSWGHSSSQGHYLGQEQLGRHLNGQLSGVQFEIMASNPGRTPAVAPKGSWAERVHNGAAEQMTRLGVTFRNCQVAENITKKLLEDRSFVEECISSDFAFLRGTPNYVYYWAQRKRDVFAMTQQLGKPTLFMTLSISELRNEHLLQLIENLNEPVEKRCHKVDDMHCLYKASLVNNDPVVCALFFDKLVRVIMVVLQNTKIPTVTNNHVVDYFKQIEFQQRGRINAHLLLWFNKAPHEDLSDDMPCSVAFVNSLMSLDTSVLSASASRYTNTFATSTKKVRTCASLCSLLANVGDTYSHPTLKHKGITLELKALCEKCKCMHSKLEEVQYVSIDEFWQNKGSVLNSNMDIEVIKDAYSCAGYVLNHVNKSNHGFFNLHTALADIE